MIAPPEVQDIDLLLASHNLSPALKAIAKKVQQGERISVEEGLLLYETGELSFLGILANHVREKKNGNYVFFNHNFHVEPTNICVYSCTFCSYSRLIKQREQGWEMTVDQIMDIIRSYDGQAVTEVHITGGVVPKQNLEFYKELFQRIKAGR